MTRSTITPVGETVAVAILQAREGAERRRAGAAATGQQEDVEPYTIEEVRLILQAAGERRTAATVLVWSSASRSAQ